MLEPSNVPWQVPIQTITRAYQLPIQLPHTLENETNGQSLPALPADKFHNSFHTDFLMLYTPVHQTGVPSTGTHSGQLLLSL
jgi:hypothetical protein